MDAVEDHKSDEEDQAPAENAWSYKVPEFKKGDMKYCLQEESSFSIMFPKYREKYLKSCWSLVEHAFKDYDIKADLDLVQGTMKVHTTRKTWDPYIILKARDVIVLLARSVPVEQAVRVLKDDVTHEIIKIKGLVQNKERFVKRRERLIGANGTTLKALELLTDCYILVQGGTVAAVGPYAGVKQVVEVVHDTMKNIHPVYLLKALMIKKKLTQNPGMKNEDWSRFMPKFGSKNVRRKKPKKLKKKPYSPFPPPQKERKVDIQLAEGKYFINQAKNKHLASKGKKEMSQVKKERLAKQYTPPEEPVYKPSTSSANVVSIPKLKKKLNKKVKYSI